MNHLMLDLETFGTRPGSVIVSVGAVVFRPEGCVPGPTFYRNVEARSCGALGMTTDADTLAFWKHPDNATALSRLSSKPKPARLSNVLEELRDFWSANECERVWGHGSCFDVVMIEEAYRRCGLDEFPWTFRQVRDTRTLFDLCEPTISRDEATYPKHDALGDALWQVAQVQCSYQDLMKIESQNHDE